MNKRKNGKILDYAHRNEGTEIRIFSGALFVLSTKIARFRDRSRLAETCKVKQSRQGLLQRSDSQAAAISA